MSDNLLHEHHDPRSPPENGARPCSTPRSSSSQTRVHGSSTEAIAAKAGISQPYVFRLFGRRKNSSPPPSSAACVRRWSLQRAAEGKPGRRRSRRWARRTGPARRSYAPVRADAGVRVCDDPGVRAVVEPLRRAGQSTSSGSRPCRPSVSSRFFAEGMLLNVITSMGLRARAEPWALGWSRAAVNDRPLYFAFEVSD